VGLTSSHKAWRVIRRGRGYLVEEAPSKMRVNGILAAMPSVVCIPHMDFLPFRRVAFNRLNVIYRDDCRCAYCGEQFPVSKLTIDHVIPKSRFAAVARMKNIPYGMDSWQNWVTACDNCNWRRKDDRLLEECGLQLLWKPDEPLFHPMITIRRGTAAARGWLKYLLPFHKKHVLVVN
jgi:hypothetical protein